jgi:hypothetical protein
MYIAVTTGGTDAGARQYSIIIAIANHRSWIRLSDVGRPPVAAQRLAIVLRKRCYRNMNAGRQH